MGEEFNQKKNSNTISKKEKLAFIERLRMVCKAKGLTVQQLQTMVGKTNAYFRNMGYVSFEMEKKIKTIIPDFNIDFANNGRGQMFLSPEQTKKERMLDDYSSIPLLPLSARGGTLTGFSEGVSTYECELITTPIEGAELAITVTGDSMEPEFPSGCVVFIKKINEKAFVEWGKTYVLDTCNGVVIKKLFPCEGEDDKFICRSVNSNYPDFSVNFTDVYGMYRVLLQMSLK